MKLLCVVQNFRQGWGGVPEATRLLAHVLAPAGISVDVYDLGRIHRAVEQLAFLPEPDTAADDFDMASLERYDAVLVMGPWQDPRRIMSLLKARGPAQPLFYLPRGGLGGIEFSRLRDLKKWPYFYLVERRIIRAAAAIIYSSDCEKRHTIRAARNLSAERIIPDFFTAPPAIELATGASHGSSDTVTFGFLAEISPRKGLVPAIDGFVRFARSLGPGQKVRLAIGGSVRRGCEGYLARARELAAAAPTNARIDFLGSINHASRERFYGEADVLLVPSLFESYGLTVLEGLAAGCAVVAGPQIGALEYLPPQDRLTIATSSGPEDLAAAITRQFAHAVREDRKDTSLNASLAIAELNRLALERWDELLHRQDQRRGNLSG